MPEELEQAKQEYLDKYKIYKDKYINWLKESKGTIFKINVPPSFHMCDGFEGDSGTTYFGGYCKIIGENDGDPIVRYMHMDLVVHQNHFYPDQKMLNYVKYYVNIHNFTGYTYESLIDLIDRPANKSELIPFIKDIMDDDYELKGYMVDSKDIENNTPPWWKNHSKDEKYIR